MKQNITAVGVDIALGKKATIGIGVRKNGKTSGYPIPGSGPPDNKRFDPRWHATPAEILVAIHRFSPDIVLVEKPMAGGRIPMSAGVNWMFGAVTYLLLEARIPIVCLTPSEIRFLQGIPNKKAAAIAAYRARFGDRVADVLEAMAFAELAEKIYFNKVRLDSAPYEALCQSIAYCEELKNGHS